MAVQTITYGDKSYLNENANVPATNKVQDIDMNEIKSVVNNNANELTNIMGKILWNNPNPTVSFSPQTITLSTNNYDMYEIIYYSSITQAGQMATGKIKKGENLYLTQTYYDTQVRVRQREVNYSSDLSLNVQEAKNNGSTQNTDLIPIYVIGYKTGLFS